MPPSPTSEKKDFDDGLGLEIMDDDQATAAQILADKQLVRIIDWKLIPYLAIIYLLSFLDRVNIGIAKLSFLERDLGLVGNQYNICLLVFFVGYVAFEIPLNVAVKATRPSIAVPIIVMVWSCIMISMGFVKNFSHLVATRFLLGLTEAPLFPGICLYLSLWYKRDELGFRLSLFFSSATLAGSLGGLIGYGISFMGGVGGIEAWAWIFIIEGLITFAFGVIGFYFVHDFPEQSKFLSVENKERLLLRLKLDHGSAGEAPFQWAHLRQGLSDYRVWLYVVMYVTIAAPIYALSLFIPTIIASLGVWTRSTSVLLATPPFFLAFIITLFSSWYSDRVMNRGYFNMLWMGMCGTGFAILTAINPVNSPGPAYFALFLCVIGVSVAIPNAIAWIGGNIGPSYKRAVGMGAFFMFGNSGGIIASTVYVAKDAPRYRQGQSIMCGLCALSVAISVYLNWDLRRENARRDRMYGPACSPDLLHEGEPGYSKEENDAKLKQWGLEGTTEEERVTLGDRHPSFRYVP